MGSRRWPKDHLYLEELYPLRYAKFGKTHILIPNKSEDYLDRFFGKSWSKEGRIYQSHLLNIELDKPIIVKGPFTPAKDFDNKKIIKYKKEDILDPPNFILKKFSL